jgi:hypothetical protein
VVKGERNPPRGARRRNKLRVGYEYLYAWQESESIAQIWCKLGSALHNRFFESPTATLLCPDSDPPPAFAVACSPPVTASPPAPGSHPSRRTLPSSHRSCASIRPTATSSTARPASTCFKAAIICASGVPASRRTLFPFLSQKSYSCVRKEGIRSMRLPIVLNAHTENQPLATAERQVFGQQFGSSDMRMQRRFFNNGNVRTCFWVSSRLVGSGCASRRTPHRSCTERVHGCVATPLIPHPVTSAGPRDHSSATHSRYRT